MQDQTSRLRRQTAGVKYILLAVVGLGMGSAMLGEEACAQSSRNPKAFEQPLKLVVTPIRIELAGARAARQVLVTGVYPGGLERDLTHQAKWETGTSHCSVDDRGLVVARDDGRGQVMVQLGSLRQVVEVEVRGTQVKSPVSFTREIVPVLSSAGCSDIRCHGAPSGKGGFRLSLWGSDHEFDYLQLVRDAFGRRTNAIDPDESLLLKKPLTRIPHVGGRRFETGSHAAKLLRRWQEQGLTQDKEAVALSSLEVTPSRRVLRAPARDQQLAVRATYTDGSTEDVTRLASYSTSDVAVARVDRSGHVEFQRQGEVAVLCRYMGQMVSMRLVHVAEAVAGFQWPDVRPSNFVDQHVYAKLKMLNIAPSNKSSDDAFVRRIYLDLCGILPTPQEASVFRASTQSDKRERLVDELLQRDEFADFWTKKWMDVLRVSRDSIQLKGAEVFQSWMREQVQRDRPLSDVMRELLTSQGESHKDPEANYFCVAPMPRKVVDVDYLQKDLAESTAQLFLGIRLQCAQCHNHPFERWTQDDYLGLAAFFSQVTRSRMGKEGPSGRADRRQIAVKMDTGKMRLADAANQHVLPHFPGEAAPEIDKGTDLRGVLADWLVESDNPYFARSIVNRVWFHLHGRGIVEPVDDFRDSNPSANDPLLDALARYFVANQFRLKPLVRAIALSNTYQASSQSNPFNHQDRQYFSHQQARSLPAEVLLDAICEVTGVPEKYEITKDYLVGVPDGVVKFPVGTRAVQLPVTDLVTLINSSSKYVRYEMHPFLRTFGTPARRQTCECDRSPGFSRKQALELTVGDLVEAKVASSSGRLSGMLADWASDREILDVLYKRALARKPTADAAEKFLAYVRNNPDRQQAWEDILWTILNSKEFIYQH